MRNWLITTELKQPEYYKGMLVHADIGLHDQAIALLQQYVPLGVSVLDVGAGSGAFSQRLADTGYAVTALNVVASLSHQRWSPTEKEQGAQWYRAMMTHWFDIRSTLPAGSYYELSLENLVTSPETVLRKVCEFTGISFDKAMLQIDPGHSHSGRWKREYSEEEKTKVQEILVDVTCQVK